MFQNLQKKLTFLYTLTTGAILTVILIICFFYMKSSMEARYKAQFSSVFLNISNRFQTEAFFTDSWLSQMEMDNSLLIHIEENDTPLFFRGAFQPETSRETLLKKARKKAVEEGITSHKAALSSPLQSSVFTVKGTQGDSYLGMCLLVSTTFGYKSLFVLQDITAFSRQLLWQGVFFLFTGLSGIFLLYLASWRTVGKPCCL